jgi:hypothetical protein
LFSTRSEHDCLGHKVWVDGADPGDIVDIKQVAPGGLPGRKVLIR